MAKKYMLFVVTHKELNLNICKYEKVICVNKEIVFRNLNKNVYYDCIDDNINYKNNYYSELTALYWIWKNVTTDIVGLEHYRRFFYFPLFGHYLLSPSKKRVIKVLDDYDIILPVRTNLEGKTLRDIFNNNAIDEFKYALKKIRDLYPFMKDAIELYLDQKHLHMCNMFIAKKVVIDEYCAWLFDFLFKLEEDFIKLGEKYHHPRIYGYISELFFDLWLQYKKYNKIFELGRQSERHSLFSHIFRRLFLKGGSND